MDVRTLLAALLGIGVGAVLIIAPRTVIRMHIAGRLPHDQGGNYGTATPVADHWRRLVQLIGLCMLILGGYFGYSVLQMV